MGEFAHVLNIRPWEIDTLTLVEFEALCGYIDEWKKQAKSNG